MDRFSLGLSLGQHQLKAVIFNSDLSKVEGQVVVKYKISDNILSLLEALDLTFLKLSEFPTLKQVAMIKVSGPEDFGICTSDHFYKCLMTFSGYAETLAQHFNGSFTLNSFLKPTQRNTDIANDWRDFSPEDSNYPDTALLFSIKNLSINNKDVFDKTKNIQFLSSFVTSILAGKRAPVDSSCARISGLQGSEFSWNESNTNWVSSDLKTKLDQIKNSYENFSYVASYFVEKYGIYREARVLTASGNCAACARGAGGSVFLDTDDKLQLSAVVNKKPSITRSFYLNGIVPGQYLCMVASNYDLVMRINTFCEIEQDLIENMYQAPILRADQLMILEKVKLSSLLISQLAELKSNSKFFEKIYVTGDMSSNQVFLQACADIFTSELIVFENSTFGAAIGNALSASRKIKESEYDSILNAYFDSTPFKVYTPSNDGINQMLSQLIAYSNPK